MKKNRISQLLGGVLLTSALAFASPITITMQNSVLSGSPGSTLTFVATASNTTGTTQFLNGDSFSIAAPLTLSDALFLNNWPLSLNASASFGPQGLFTVFIPLSAPVGPYLGTFNLLGGPGVNDSNVLGTVNFEADVATPEPATFVLTGGALLALCGLLRRRRNA
jgi:hypothetical protein